MGRRPAVVGDTWTFWLSRLQAGGVPLTNTTPALTIQASVVLNGAPWGGPYTPTYVAGTGRWEFQLELPGPGVVAVRWLITYGLLTKTIETSETVEERGGQVSVIGQSNLSWDVGPAGPPGAGSNILVTQAGGSPSVIDTLNFASGANVGVVGTTANVTLTAATTLTRTLPTTLNGYVDIGFLNTVDGTHTIRVSLTVSAGGFSVSKQYLFSSAYGSLPGWRVASPVMNSGPYGGNDFELLVMQGGATFDLRIRRTAGSAAGDVVVSLENTGLTADALTALTGTGTDATAYPSITTFPSDITVPGEVYGAGWNGSFEAPTKNDVYDKIQSLVLGGGGGSVVGPVSSTDNALAVWDGTSGALLQNSSVDIADVADAVLTLGPSGVDLISDLDDLYLWKSVFNQKGELLVGTSFGNSTTLLPGTTGQILKANSALITGVEWAADLSAGVVTTRTAPTVVNDYVEIGTWDQPDGVHVLLLTLTPSSAGMSIAKTYLITTQWNATANTWRVKLPLQDTGPEGANDVELLMRQGGNTLNLRIRRTGGSTADASLGVRILNLGEATDVFTASTATGSDATAYSTHTPLVDVVRTASAQSIAGVKTFTSTPLIPDEAYGGAWDTKLEPPTKNAVYDKIQSLVLGSGSGDVVGPASATDNALVRFDLATGKLVQNSGAILGDTGSLYLSGTTPSLQINDSDSVTGGSGGILFSRSNTVVWELFPGSTATPGFTLYNDAVGDAISVAGATNMVSLVRGVTVGDATDITKKLTLALGGIATATTRTWTVQDISGTVYVSGGTDIPIADGGTGASSAATALTNLGAAPLASPTFTGTVGGITKAMVGLGNVDNTSDVNKPVSTAQQTALDGKAPVAAKYIVQQADATLTGEQALGALATGILKNTTTTGVLSIAVAGTDYETAGTSATHAALTGTAVHGLGTMSTQAASAVAITGGSIAGITDLAIADGGTGASSAQAAINALSAVSGATNEHVLTKDTASGNAIWKAATGGGGGGTPGGSTTQVQYNNAGAFAGSSDFTFSSRAVHLTNDGVNPVLSLHLDGAAQAPTQIYPDGMSFGSGSAATDVDLFRSGVGALSISGSLAVTDEAYNATGWNGNLTVPTKNAVRDKIESLVIPGGVPSIARTFAMMGA